MQASMYYSIDVECVATGTDHNSRGVAQISLVVRPLAPTSVLYAMAGARRVGAHPPLMACCIPQDQYEQVLLNAYVKPDQPVVSYLTPLTG